MGKYSCSLMLLVQTVAQSTSDASKVKQVWYEDDAAGGGKLDEVLRWWENRATVWLLSQASQNMAHC